MRRRHRRNASLVVAAVVLAVAGGVGLYLAIGRSSEPAPGAGTLAPSPAAVVPVVGAQFSYGFDLAQQGPYSDAQESPDAVASARRVIASIPGLLEVTPIMGWGLPSPEPSPGVYDLSALAGRISLIQSTGGTPVVTLCAAPDWMKRGTGTDTAPTPDHYGDFAALAAKIAASFPQVKYFVVWNEFKGFWNATANDWNIQGYTAMYDEVYRAVKQVRPDAQVGGPYAVLPTLDRPVAKTLPTSPQGPWGFVDQRTVNALSYWLGHAAGADFVAVDGRDFLPSGALTTDPLTASEKYAAVDQWLSARTSLPIWWMESHIQPDNSGWSPERAAAVRVAALLQMASSGARVGMQWQPQQGEGISDEGLWTATETASGGRPTVLAQVLPRVLEVLRRPVTAVPGQPPGVLVVSGASGTIAVNTTAGALSALVDGKRVPLPAGGVRVL